MRKQLLLDALEKAKEPTLPDLLVDYFNLRNEQRSDWSGTVSYTHLDVYKRQLSSLCGHPESDNRSAMVK